MRLRIRGVSAIQATIDRRIRKFTAIGRNYSKIERNCRVTSESSTKTTPSFVEICETGLAMMKLLETEQKSDGTLARYGATVERSARTIENSDAILTSMAGINIPTPMADMWGTAPVGGTTIAGGITTEEQVVVSPQVDSILVSPFHLLSS
jgi:hypothetical protein